MKLLNLLRRITFLILIVYIASAPVIIVIILQSDLKYELVEIYGEEDPIEREIVVDVIENQDQGFCLKQNLSLFHSHKGFIDFSPDIQLPPPKKES